MAEEPSLGGSVETSAEETQPPNNKDTVAESPKSPDGSRKKSRAMYEDARSRLIELKKSYDEDKVAHAQRIAEKDATIDELKTQLEKMRERKDDETKPMVMKMKNSDMFVSKPRRGAKDVPSTGCEVSGCENINVDFIKCCMCEKLVCEDCSKVKIAKLRPLVNQCDMLYFTCQNCSLLLRDDNDINALDILQQQIKALKQELESEEKENDKLSKQIKTMEDLLEEREKTMHETEAKIVNLEQNLSDQEATLQETENKLVSMERSSSNDNNEASSMANFEDLITKRMNTFDKKMEELIEKKIAGVLQIPSTAEQLNSGESHKSFASVVGASLATTPISQIADLKASHNAELIEKQEQEKRMNNIIIHGIDEGATEENSNPKTHDENFIKAFLEAIEVDITPKQILRIGNKTANKKRPVKVILKNAEDKRQIMSNLNKLKNAAENIRGISVRDDYTQEERKLIQTMHEEAKRKNEADKVTHWKVRGTPKNGLRVVKITTRI